MQIMNGKEIIKYLVLWMIGGMLYIVVEVLWRGSSHWTMFVLGGICFVMLGLLNELFPWEVALWRQVLAGACMITVLEFITGCIVNLWLGWHVWDYHEIRGNVLGQICPRYFLLWIPISLFGIILDDWLRYLWFGEERPRYRLGGIRMFDNVIK